MTQSQRKRPLGVVLVALFYLIGALFFIVKTIREPETVAAAVPTPPQIIIFALMISISLVICLGLLLLGNWARSLMVIHLFLNGLSFVLAGYSPLNISTLIGGLLLAYVFLHPACKAAFAHEQ